MKKEKTDGGLPRYEFGMEKKEKDTFCLESSQIANSQRFGDELNNKLKKSPKTFTKYSQNGAKNAIEREEEKKLLEKRHLGKDSATKRGTREVLH